MKDKPENPGFFFTLQETASATRCSTRTILRALEQGQIRGKLIRGRYLFTHRAVLAYGMGFGTRLSASERKEFQELSG